MRIYRWGIMPLLCLLCIKPATAQNDESGILSSMGFTRYITLSGGGAFHEVLDRSVADIRYMGFGWAATLGHIKQNENNYSELFIQPSVATLTKDILAPSDPKIKSYRAALDYKQLVRIKLRNERYDFRPGGMLSMNYGFRKAPHVAGSGNVHEYAISLGIAARLAKEIELQDHRLAHLSWALGLPLVAHYSRPGYLNSINRIDPDDKPGADFLANSRTSFIGKYFRVNSRLTYDYALTNGNVIAIGYTWDYYTMKTESPVWFAEHTVSFTFMFNY